VGFRQGLPHPRSHRRGALQGIPFLLVPKTCRVRGGWSLTPSPGLRRPHGGHPHTAQSAFPMSCFIQRLRRKRNAGAREGCIPKWASVLADVSLIYEDNGTHVLPICRRFETNEVTTPWRALMSSLLCRPVKIRAVKLTSPLANALEWGVLQTSSAEMAWRPPAWESFGSARWENPEPDANDSGCAH